MKGLNGVWKGILLAGAFSGVISLIPLINFFNIFFMMWMGAGGFLAIFLLKKENTGMTAVNALIVGALSGITGGLIFGLVSTAVILNISEEKIEKLLDMAGKFSALLGQDISDQLTRIDLKSAFLGVIMLAVIFSVLAGAIGGLIAKFVFFPGKNNKDK